MTVIDTSVVVDHLLATGVAAEATALFTQNPVPAAPDILVFETLAALRRLWLRGELEEERAAAAVEDLGGLSIEFWPSLPLRARAWTLRTRLTAADALFVALAEALREPLVTKDAALARGAERHADVALILLAR